MTIHKLLETIKGDLHNTVGAQKTAIHFLLVDIVAAVYHGPHFKRENTNWGCFVLGGHLAGLVSFENFDCVGEGCLDLLSDLLRAT